MQKLLRKAAASLYSTLKFDKDQMHNYFMSGEFKHMSMNLLRLLFAINGSLLYNLIQ